MAISINNVKKSKDKVQFNNKKYMGYSAFEVLAINPTTDEIRKIYNSEDREAPAYVRKTIAKVKGEDKEVNQAMVQIHVKPFVLGEDAPILSFTMFIVDAPAVNSDGTKVKVIDKYGRTAWVTIEQFKNKQIPMYANGKPANIDADYRACKKGEEELIEFIKKYMNIPNCMKFNATDRSWSLIDTPEIAECSLENIDNMFKGDFSEIQQLMDVNPNGSIGLLIGIKMNPENGRLYHNVFTHQFPYVKFDGSMTEKGIENLTKAVEENQERYKNTTFMVQPLAELIEQPGSITVNTDVPADETSDVFVTPTAPATTDPFANAEDADELPF